MLLLSRHFPFVPLRYCLALLFILAIPLWNYVLAPSILAIGDDFRYSAHVISKDDLYDEQARRFTGETLSTTTFSYDGVERRGNILLIRNAFDVRKQNGEPIFAVERLYGVDRRTGQHVPGYGDRSREGHLFAPRFLNKQDVLYWHVNYNAPASLKFQAQERIAGLTVYRYADTFHTDQTENLRHLPGVGTTRGINLDINLQVWFEPVSGRMVKYADQATAYYYDLSTGRRMFPWNHFSNAYALESVTEQVAIASREKLKVSFLSLYVPIILLILSGLTMFSSSAWRQHTRLAMKPGFVVAWTLAGLCFLLTLVLSGYMRKEVNDRARDRFEAETTLVLELVTDRMDAHLSMLEGAKSMLDARGMADRDAWKRYADALRLPERFPGAQGLGFSPIVPREQKEAHESAVRAEGFPEYVVIPAGDRKEYAPVVYLEPFDLRNKRAFGYDVLSEPTRASALSEARDTGAPALTGKTTLIQETEASPQAGVLLYIPVYRASATPDTPEQRREALIGYVSIPFRMDDVMSALLAGRRLGIDVQVYDGTEENVANAEKLIYNSLSRSRIVSTPRFQTVRTVSVVGRPWTFHFSAVPGYNLKTVEEWMPAIVLGTGLTFVVLTLLTMVFLRHTVRHAMSKRCPLIVGGAKRPPCRAQ